MVGRGVLSGKGCPAASESAVVGAAARGSVLTRTVLSVNAVAAVVVHAEAAREAEKAILKAMEDAVDPPGHRQSML